MAAMIFSAGAHAIAEARIKEHTFLRDLSALTPIVLLFLLLAFYQIDHQSLWTDEVASLAAAAPNESFFSKAVWLNGQGPLYFAFLHLWMALGTSELAVRSLAAIFGTAVVILIYALGLRFGDRKLAAISALLMATSPFLIWYSQETRYITLAIAASLLSVCFFRWALDSDLYGAWVVYAVTTAMALFSFVPDVFLPAAQGLYLLLSRDRRRQIPKWMAWQTGVSLVFGAWLLVSYGGLSIASKTDTGLEVALDPVSLETGTPKETSPWVIPYTFWAFTTGFSLGPSVEELHVSRELSNLRQYLLTLALFTIFFGSLFLRGIIHLFRRAHMPGLVVLCLAVPIAGVLAISASTAVAYNVRYVCAAMPAYILILGAGIAAFRTRAVQLSVLAMVLLANGLSLAQYYFNPRYAKADARGAAQYLASVGDPQDVILLVGSSTAWSYYYKGDLPVVQWSRADNRNRESISKKVQALNNRYDRLWLVEIRPWETDPRSNVEATLNSSLKKTQEKTLPGVTIAGYVRRN